jgi:hypothetical protein
MSEKFLVNGGVKQGDNLSPILFNVFVDDIVNYFENVPTNHVYLDVIPINHMFFLMISYLYQNHHLVYKTVLMFWENTVQTGYQVLPYMKNKYYIIPNTSIDDTEHRF